jgi:uncharacterized protein (DUF1800 family)
MKIKFLALVYTLALVSCGGGGGAGSPNPNTSPTNNFVNKGPISGGVVKVYTLLNTQIGTGTTTVYDQTRDSELINSERRLKSIANGREVGKITLTTLDTTNLNSDDLIRVEVSDGTDIDPNDDGVITNGKQLKGKLYGITTLDDLQNGKVIINALTTIAYGLVANETQTATIKTKLDKVAKHYFKTNLNGDTDVDFKALYSYNPSKHNFDNKHTRVDDEALHSKKLYQDNGTTTALIQQIVDNNLSIASLTSKVKAIFDDNDGDGEIAIFDDNENHRPIANAGFDKLISYSQTITLNGKGFDSDGDILTFSWTQTSGVAQVFNKNSPTITITTPSVDDTLTFVLQVSDGTLTATDDVSLFIKESLPYQVIKNNTTDKVNLVGLTANGAKIYYTLDGTTPTTNSNLYTDIIIVNSNQTLKFIAVSNGIINNNLLNIANYQVSSAIKDDDNDGVSNLTEVKRNLNPLSSSDIVSVSSNVPSGCCLFSSCLTMVTTTKTVGVAANLVGGSDNGNLSTINLDKGFLEFNELTGEYSFTPHHNACTQHPYGELCLTSFEYEVGGITHKITLNIDRELEFASSNTTAIIGENKTLVVDPDGEPVNINITTAPTIGNTTIAKSQATYSSTVNNYVLTNINDFVDSEIDIVKFNVTDINNNTSSKTINITLDLGDDSDNGGIHDVLEDHFGFNKNNVSDDTADNDSDKINNTTEIFLTYNPLVDETLPQTTDADKLNFKVMNRLAFGVNSTLTTQITDIGGIDNWLDDQLSSNQIQTNLDDGKNNNLQDKMDDYYLRYHYRLEVLPTVRPLHADNQLQAVMARFWDNHFNTNFGDHLLGFHELGERDQFYLKALGNFKDLVMFSAKSAVMSRYLNGNTNVKGKPNENFAREIMELHTLGVEGGYTDEDIKQLARIFTGWSFAGDNVYTRYRSIHSNLYPMYKFDFNATNHDDGDNKPFLTTVPDTPDYDDGVGTRTIASRSGDDGVIEGEKAIDILAKHPTTAKYLCTKLTKFLVSDNPLEDTINACKNEFIFQQEASDQIAKVIKVIFNTDEFKDIASSKRKLKDSQEYYLSIGRLLEIDALKYNAENSNYGNLGWNIYNDQSQRFFQKPEPTGYPEVSSQWNKTDIAFSKITQLNRILQDNRDNYKKVDLIKFFKDKNLTTAKEIIEFLLPKITAGYYDGAFVQQAYDILRPNNAKFNIDSNSSNTKLQKLLGFLLASPEFNLH